MFPRARGVTFYLSSIFLKNLFQLTPILTFDFTVTIVSNSSVCNNFYDGKIRFQQEGIKHYFPSNEKKKTTHVNEEREKVSPANSSSNVEPGYSKKSQNEDLINSISALINTRLKEFRFEMIPLINKNGIQPMSVGDRDSYDEDFETNNLPKADKEKTGDTCSHNLSALVKNSAENNNNDGEVVGHKRPITNDGGSNTPAKVPCFQNSAKAMSDVQVDMEILNQVEQEHQILQNLGDSTLGKLVTVIKKYWL